MVTYRRPSSCAARRSSTPMIATLSNRAGSPHQDPRASARTASFAVSHATAELLRRSGPHQMLHDQCEQGPTAVQPGRSSRAGSAAAVVSRCHTRLQPVHRWRRIGDQQRRVATRTARAPAGVTTVVHAFSQPHPAPPVIIDNPASQHCTISARGAARSPPTRGPSRQQNVVRSGVVKGTVGRVGLSDGER